MQDRRSLYVACKYRMPFCTLAEMCVKTRHADSYCMNRIPNAVLVRTAILCGVLLTIGLIWREALLTGEIPISIPGVTTTPGGAPILPTLHHPFVELAKLVAAFLVGLAITVIHRYSRNDPSTLGASMEHAQVLLCVSGALMMIIIGDSLARAFGIAGAASIIRFRTPVEDPKDTIVLFLVLGLGMASGLGAFAVVGLGTAFFSGVLIFLSDANRLKRMTLTLVSSEADFPKQHVQQVLSRFHVQFETYEVIQGSCPAMKYLVVIDPSFPIERASEALQSGEGVVIQSVSWEAVKKKKG